MVRRHLRAMTVALHDRVLDELQDVTVTFQGQLVAEVHSRLHDAAAFRTGALLSLLSLLGASAASGDGAGGGTGGGIAGALPAGPCGL